MRAMIKLRTSKYCRGDSMAFRAEEAARAGYEAAESYLIGRLREVSAEERARSKEALQDIVDELGPVIDAYPSWHPLVRNHDGRSPVTWPNRECGYSGLDHTQCFAHGFVTCPYDDGQAVLDSVEKLAYKHQAATITAERLKVKFYSESATPILVKCHWAKTLPMDKLIPLSIAMPLLLEMEVPCWEWSQLAETWETMRPYFLGEPRGAKSSLFVSQETGQSIKKVWEALIYTGMFGPIKV
jgi:hypothetical protein